MPAINTPGRVTIDFEITGKPDDPTLILIRGAGAQRVRWQPILLQGLAASALRIVTFDNRDTGKSTNFEHVPTPTLGEFIGRFMQGESIRPAYTLEDMAGDVIGLMDGLKIDRAHVAGLSLGGYIGQLVAAKYPDRVRSYISLASSPFAPGLDRMAPRLAERVMRGPDGTSEEALANYSVDVARLFAGDVFPLDEAELRAVLALEKQRGIAPGGETRQIMAALVGGDRSATCRQIRVPTLILHGTDDPAVPFAEAQELAKLVSGSVLRPIEGAGHEITPTLVPILIREIGSFCQQH